MSSDTTTSQGCAPKVQPSEIDVLVARCQYETFVVPSTNTTLVAAVLDDFVLAVGQAHCVSKENFDADIGYKYAREDAERRARDKLWELKGWELKQRIRGEL